MKRIIFFSILIVCAVSMHAQKTFIYGDDGTKIYFEPIDSLVQIKYKKQATDNEKLNIAKTIKPNLPLKATQTDREIVPIDKKIKFDLDEIKKNKSVAYANKSLLSDDGVLQIPTNKVLVKVKSPFRIEDILRNLRIEYEQYKRLGHDEQSYLIVLNDGESMAIANKLYESGYFDYAQPSFTRFKGLLNEYYNNQWGLNNTGQYGGSSGIDIKAPQAWNITTGSSSIKVAVVDQGVDLTHPDLAANLLSGYDATDGALGGTNGACLSRDAHGTACAGIIAAIDNTIGTKGVAPNCKVIPVRVSYTAYSSYYQQYIEIWEDNWTVAAINYAWQIAGADVISCSWGGGSNISALTNEIHYAVTQGRNNKGCVVIFASGNGNASSVNYPASLSDVIAAGAISTCGQRKSTTSCDGETTWGSNYGTALNVVAPGVKIYTTDIQSTGGYNTSNGVNGNYYASFNGTSAACPHVAGVAALVLSVRPDLTAAQVRQAIGSTCTKLSGYTFSSNSSHPNGTWNSEVGHGLVNAYQAVYSVAQQISGPSTVCFSGKTFSLSNVPSGATVQWSITGSSFALSNQTNTSVTVTKTGVNGSAELTAAIYVNGSLQTTVSKDVTSCQTNISGPSIICPGTTINYTVTNAPAGYTWGCSINLTPVSDSPGTFAVSSATGSAWVSINLNGVELARKNINVGNTGNTFTISGPDYITSTGTTRYEVSPNCTPHPVYRWILYKYNYNLSLGEYPDTCDLKTYTNVVAIAQSGQINPYDLQLWAGGTLVATKQISVNGYSLGLSCQRPMTPFFVSYSNPANNDLTVSFDEAAASASRLATTATTKQARIIEVVLYDMYGQALRRAVSAGEAVQFDVSGLKDGMYYLHVLDGSQAEPVKRTVIIKH